jgi:hypothetical protein
LFFSSAALPLLLEHVVFFRHQGSQREWIVLPSTILENPRVAVLSQHVAQGAYHCVKLALIISSYLASFTEPPSL